MVDGGAPNRVKQFRMAIENINLNPKDISLMTLTHGHWDHIGSAKEIKDLTGATVAMHKREIDCLEQSQKPMPTGVTLWGGIVRRLIRAFLSLNNIHPTKVDLALGDESMSLSEFGIPGKLIHTPGHTSGSMSVLLETGEAFVGDLAINNFPLTLSPVSRVFAQNWEILKKSWQNLLVQGAKMVYPAHGKSFSVDIIRNLLQ